jgi:hypothetical protein
LVLRGRCVPCRARSNRLVGLGLSDSNFKLTQFVGRMSVCLQTQSKAPVCRQSRMRLRFPRRPCSARVYQEWEQ